LRETLVRHGYERVRSLSWRKAAEYVRNAYDRVQSEEVHA
jgi:hypothetical protein